MAWSKEQVEHLKHEAEHNPDPAIRASCMVSLHAIYREPAKEEARLDAEEGRRAAAAAADASSATVRSVGQIVLIVVGAIAILMALTDSAPLTIENVKLQVGIAALGMGVGGKPLLEAVKKLGAGKGVG